MVDWASVVAVIALLGILAFGWFRGWSMVQSLIVSMFVVFLVSVFTASRLDLSIAGSPLLDTLAWRPEYLSLGAFMHWPTLVSTMFLHGDAIHIVMNIVIFVFMGMGFEERVGRGRVLLVFVLGGMIGTLLHSLFEGDLFGGRIPVVGASGGVFAVIAAYATLYPRDKVVLFFILILPNVPVYIAALAYTAMEVVALETVGQAGGVARYAHLGGIVGGAFLAFAIMRIRPVAAPGRPAGRPIDAAALATRVSTPEQREVYERFLANQDEPELAKAWLERLVATLPCERCGASLHVGRDELRCVCGNRVRYRA